MKYSTSWIGTIAPPSVPVASGSSWAWGNLAEFVQAVWQRISYPGVAPSELQVWQTHQQDGTVWWNAYDPATGRRIYQVTESELCVWVEQRYLP